MTRHSKNATAGPTYTYHEKTKDSQQSGYGSKNERLGKDAIKDFDCCSLSLQPCTNPVITDEGWIYEKEIILEYILHKKIENTKLLKAFAKQSEEKNNELKDLEDIKTKEKLTKFLKHEGKLVISEHESSANVPESKEKLNFDSSKKVVESVSNMQGNLSKKLPSFWIPSLCPQSKTKTPMKKPDTTIYCPMSGKPIAMKNLIDIKFKLLEDKNDTRSLIARTDRYVCPISNDILGNSVPCVVLRTSGSVVTAESVEKIVKKDMIDPINGKKLTEKDIIYIQRGGTGYAGSGVKLNSKIIGPAMIS